MVGKGRHPILCVRSIDPVLSLAASIGLSASMGTGLVVDLGVPGAPTETGRSLRDLASDGPTSSELSPGRTGVAFISGGGMDPDEVFEILSRLAGNWPAISVRVHQMESPFPVVPVVPLYPGRLLTVDEPRGVWQPVGDGGTPSGPGPVMPRLRPTTLRRILAGQLPRRSRWIEAWRPIWSMPWA